MKKIRLFIFTAILLWVVSANAQPPSDMTIDAATRAQVIEELLKNLKKSYVYLETAKLMEADIRRRLGDGEYERVTSAGEFAVKLTQDLQAVSRDKHLRIYFSSEKIPVKKKNAPPTKEERAAEIFFQKRLNSGVEKVERLEGNIGYINLRGFYDVRLGAAAVASAMSLVADTDALIFDLRRNDSNPVMGDPAMVQLLCSYFFGNKPVHLNDIYYREIDKTISYWTKPNAAGRKYINKPVYILTNKQTFSAAEAFAYNLKNLKRATIIGEVTRGGAHPGDSVRLTEHFGVNIPMGRAINPITKTNWEGTGVTPDVIVPKEQAFKVAYIMALNKASEKVPYGYIKEAMKEIAGQTQKELDEMKKTK